ERFFRRIARAMGEAGYLKLFFMEIDGQRVAAVWCFDMGNVRYLYNSGFNPAFGHLSVGLLLKAFCLKDAIETGMDYFDFLRGDERYKYDLGAQDVVLYNMVVSR
ncbi:MAG: Acetyltransferase involved in cellulose biosynthesis, CelD/BcsL family, partial [Chloroflexi bacterium]